MNDELQRKEVEMLRDQNAELRGRLDAILLSFETFILPGAEDIEVTAAERDILKILHDRMPKIVSKRTMFDIMYGLRNAVDCPNQKIIDVLICKLRAKLKGRSWEIKTTWGAGYSLHEVHAQ